MVRFHLIHVLRAVINPFAMSAWDVIVGNLEMIEYVLEVVELIVCRFPFPTGGETNLVSA